MYTIEYWRESGIKRVIYVGTNGSVAVPCRIVSLSRDGARVRWADGRVERVHPDDLRARP